MTNQPENPEPTEPQDSESVPHTDTPSQSDRGNQDNTENLSNDNTWDTALDSENVVQTETDSEPQSESQSESQSNESQDNTDENSPDLRTAINFGDDVNAEDIESFISLSEQLGLNGEQAQNAWDTLQQAQAEQQQADTALAKAYEGKLRQVWGHDYDNNYASAQQGMLSAGGDDLRDVLTEAGIVNHPVVMQAFASIGQSHLEQGTVSSAGGGVNNPFDSDSYNLTEQMRLYRENPSLAAMLEKAATSS